ncbi:MAG: translation initiation factor IF-3 [Actinomycetota bacterium]
MNRQIPAREVRLVSESGEQLGIKSIEEALRIADDAGMDLVEVAPQERPPVCRIMDYGRFKFEQEKKAKKARKNQSLIVVKEIKLRVKIDKHDFATKRKHVERFLSAGQKVKVVIMFRGREMAHTELGKKLLDRLYEEVQELGLIESPARVDGRDMIMILAPTQKKEAARADA